MIFPMIFPMIFRRPILQFLLVFTSFGAAAIPTQGHKMMISAPTPYAVEVGREIIAMGGNVVDVAVAVSLTLAVTSPYFGSLGGGGFALVKMGDKVEALDFREVAPLATGPDTFANKEESASKTGGLAIGVPGLPAGLWALHSKYGKLPWRQLFTMPTRLAQQGFRVSGEWVKLTGLNKNRFNSVGLKTFFENGERLLKPGEVLRQPGLASALRELSRRNVKGFYQGPVAADIIAAAKASGGVMVEKDLKDYKVRWLEPLTTELNEYKIHLMPPPSSGGIVIKTALDLVKKVNLPSYQPLSADELHLLGEVLARSFRGRELLGDPDFHRNPLDQIMSESYLNEMARSISLKKSQKLANIALPAPKESTETTHFSVLDSSGNAVAFTVTLNGNYGSGVVTSKYGISLNNEMDDFTTRKDKPNMFKLYQGEGNRVQPGKRPLSSMSPTLIEKDRKIIISLGAPGGPRIISAVFQAIYRLLISKFDIDAAIQFPRVHHQFQPHTLYLDANRLSPEIIAELKKRGHEINETWIARVYGVRINDDGILEAAFDSRGEGAAGGL